MISDVITAVDWAVDDGGFDRDSPWLLTTLPNIRVDLDFGSFIAYCFSFRFSSEWTSRRCPQRAESKEIDTERRRPKTTNKNKRETRLTLRCCGTSFFFCFFCFFCFFFSWGFRNKKEDHTDRKPLRYELVKPQTQPSKTRSSFCPPVVVVVVVVVAVVAVEPPRRPFHRNRRHLTPRRRRTATHRERTREREREREREVYWNSFVKTELMSP